MGKSIFEFADKFGYESPLKGDWSTYSPADLGNTFSTNVGLRIAGKCYLYDNLAMFADHKLADHALKLPEGDATVYIYTIASEDLDKLYAKVAVQSTEICCFLWQGGAKNLYMKLKIPAKVEARLPLRNGLKLADLKLPIRASRLDELKSQGISARSILGLVDAETIPFDSLKSGRKRSSSPPFNAGSERLKSPGTSAFAHLDIEADALFKPLGNKREKVLETYYGNWLRDFSQVNVGALISPPIDWRKRMQQRGAVSKQAKDILDGTYSQLTQDGLVRLVELLAAKEFFYEAYEKLAEELHPQNRLEYVKPFRERYGELTRDILGVYRPEEHIDNPKGQIDDSKETKEYAHFQYEYPKGGYKKVHLYNGETPESSKVDAGANTLVPGSPTGLKYYLFHDVITPNQELRPAATTYMKQQIELAVAYGNNQVGLRHLGAAMHVLEDFFAHTNFVEVTMIKLGRVKVFPWVEMVAETNNDVTKPKSPQDLQNPALRVVLPPYSVIEGTVAPLATHIPIVTGVFLMDDTLASGLPKIAEAFKPEFEAYFELKSGERTFNDILIRTVLEDLATTHAQLPESERPTYGGMYAATILAHYDWYLVQVDKWRKARENKLIYYITLPVDYLGHWVGQGMSFFNDVIINILLSPYGEETKEAQSNSGINIGTDPTHTQIAKDSARHPLNPLAGQLAVAAVRDVGERIVKAWNGQGMSGKQLATYVADTYFVHPCKTMWMDQLVIKWISDNPSAVSSAEHKTIYEQVEKVVVPVIEDGKKVIDEMKKGAK